MLVVCFGFDFFGASFLCLQKELSNTVSFHVSSIRAGVTVDCASACFTIPPLRFCIAVCLALHKASSPVYIFSHLYQRCFLGISIYPPPVYSKPRTRRPGDWYVHIGKILNERDDGNGVLELRRSTETVGAISEWTSIIALCPRDVSCA